MLKFRNIFLKSIDILRKIIGHLFFFDRSIKGYLSDKICILVTHQIQFLQDATKILVLNNVNISF
jgi:hypothetical protein